MKHIANTALHIVGTTFALIGFCIFIGAGGNCDLGADVSDVMPYLFKGFALLFGGIFLTWWRV